MLIASKSMAKWVKEVIVVSIKNRLKRLERKIPDVYQDTLDFLKLSWRITHGSLHKPDLPPEVRQELEAQAREMVDHGQKLSIEGLLQKIDGRSQPLPKIKFDMQEGGSPL